LAAPRLTANVTPLANYLSVRALEREQARVEAMQENLQETLRLRRETRFYRWREAEAARIAAERRAAEEEAERARRDAEAAAKAAEEAEAAQAAAAEAEAAEARRRDAAAAAEQRRQDAQRQQQAAEGQRGRAAAQARQQRAVPQAAPEEPTEPDSTLPPGVNFSRPIPEAPPGDSSRFPSLPGVANPLEF
ncbi:MAG: AsmA protein, partial [Aurantimonas coralicida]